MREVEIKAVTDYLAGRPDVKSDPRYIKIEIDYDGAREKHKITLTERGDEDAVTI